MRRTCGSGDLGSKKTGLLLLSRREVRSVSGSDALSEQQHAPMRTAICSTAVCSVRLAEARSGDVVFLGASNLILPILVFDLPGLAPPTPQANELHKAFINVTNRRTDAGGM